MTHMPPARTRSVGSPPATGSVPLAEAYRQAGLQGRDLRIVRLRLELGWHPREIAAEVGTTVRQVEQRIIVLRTQLEHHGARWEKPGGGRLFQTGHRRRA